MAVRLSIGASRRQLVAPAARPSRACSRVSAASPACSSRAGRSTADRVAAAGRGGRSDARSRSTRRSCCSRPRWRSAPACSSASSRRCTARGRIWSSTLKGQAGQPSARAAAARFRTSLVDGADRAVDGAARLGRAVHQEPGQRQPRRSRAARSTTSSRSASRRELNGYTPRAVAAALRAARGRARGAARRDRRHRGAWCRCSPATTGATASRSRVRGGARIPTPNARFNEVGPATSGRSACRCSPAASSRAPTSLGAPKVAIVNEAFAKKFNLGRDAVGKRMATAAATTSSSTSRSSASCRTRSTAT